MDPEFIARLSAGWYGRQLDAADAAGVAGAIAPVEKAMRQETQALGFEDMNLARFAASLERHARD